MEAVKDLEYEDPVGMDDALEHNDVADKDREEWEVHMLPPMMVNPKVREADCTQAPFLRR